MLYTMLGVASGCLASLFVQHVFLALIPIYISRSSNTCCPREARNFGKISRKCANWEKIKIQLGKIFFPIGNLKLGISEKDVNMSRRTSRKTFKVWHFIQTGFCKQFSPIHKWLAQFLLVENVFAGQYALPRKAERPAEKRIAVRWHMQRFAFLSAWHRIGGAETGAGMISHRNGLVGY